ncbi:MAG: magnesium chelatase domain-containing protein, partial [Microgenomates group bacterium]
NFNIQPLTSNFPLLIIDSVQTLWSEEIEGAPGSVSQVKWCTQKLIELAKKSGIIIVLIGQINKEGEIAGPMMLSHMVDCVLFLEGERFSDLRLLRGLKNRFGPVDEVGVLRMTDKGMQEVKNPSEMFLGDHQKEKAGAIVICAIEGTRPMLLEIQALVTQSALPVPRRVVLGLDYNRVLLIIAVLQKILRLPLYNQEIIVKVGGGFKISEPAADLGIALAIISSFRNKPVVPKTAVFGEVGLLGEVRRVSGEEKRTKEAKKLGFTNILSSSTVRDLQEAIKAIV